MRPSDFGRTTRYEPVFRSLVEKGYVGIIVEMVSSTGGEVLHPKHWDALARACEETGLYLVVDEAMTAIRCGAPFACLRTEYSKFHPSFVLYGKGLRVCGLAAFSDGVTIRRMGYTLDTLRGAVIAWGDRLSSEVTYVRPLLDSWAIIRCAQEENWTERAISIGEHLRELLTPVSSRSGGLGSLLYIRKEHAARANVIGAAAGSQYIRWIPYLDVGMHDRQLVRILFGPGSQCLREELKTVLCSSNSCVVCGDTGDHDARPTICDICFCPICNVCSEVKTKDTARSVKRHMDGHCLEEDLSSLSSQGKQTKNKVVEDAALGVRKRARLNNK